MNAPVFAKPWTHRRAGQRMAVAFNEGQSCPDDLVEEAKAAGVLQKPKRAKKAKSNGSTDASQGGEATQGRDPES